MTSFHLIEHITSPVYFLKKIQSLIKKDGYILLELPNIENTLMDLSPEFNDFNYIRDHVAYYSPKLIRRVVEEAGFEVIAQKRCADVWITQLYELGYKWNSTIK